MRVFFCFLSGLASVLSFAYREKEKYPFAHPSKTPFVDWSNLVSDLNYVLDEFEKSKSYGNGSKK